MIKTGRKERKVGRKERKGGRKEREGGRKEREGGRKERKGGAKCAKGAKESSANSVSKWPKKQDAKQKEDTWNASVLISFRLLIYTENAR